MIELYKLNDYYQASFKRFYQRKIYSKLQDKIRTIAIYKSGGGLGDLVQSIPLFRSFRQMFPKAKITYLGLYQRPRCDTLFSNIPYIDEYIEYVRPGKESPFKAYFDFLKKYSRKFDLIVDTQSKFAPAFYLWLLKPRYLLSRSPFFSHWVLLPNPKARVHIVAKMLALVRALGLREINLIPQIEISQEYLCLAQDYLKGYPGRFVSILPGAGHPFKMWPKEKFAALGDRLYTMGYQVILIGSEVEKGLLLEVAGMMKNKPIIPLIDESRFGQDPIYSIGLFKSSQ
ncbi:MAG: glycosyltransferase family 9 protein, partial [Candidatus Omnitrophota bacterium]